MYKAKVNGNIEHKIDLQDGQGTIDGQPFELDLQWENAYRAHAVYNGQSLTIDIVEHSPEIKTTTILIDGVRYDVELTDKYDDLLKDLGMEVGASAKMKTLNAPMPGLVLDVMVKSGQEVAQGEPLVILEAMKMENVIKSPGAGVVQKITVTKNQTVEKNEILVEFA